MFRTPPPCDPKRNCLLSLTSRIQGTVVVSGVASTTSIFSPCSLNRTVNRRVPGQSQVRLRYALAKAAAYCQIIGPAGERAGARESGHRNRLQWRRLRLPRPGGDPQQNRHAFSGRHEVDGRDFLFWMRVEPFEHVDVHLREHEPAAHHLGYAGTHTRRLARESGL